MNKMMSHQPQQHYSSCCCCCCCCRNTRSSCCCCCSRGLKATEKDTNVISMNPTVKKHVWKVHQPLQLKSEEPPRMFSDGSSIHSGSSNSTKIYHDKKRRRTTTMMTIHPTKNEQKYGTRIRIYYRTIHKQSLVVVLLAYFVICFVGLLEPYNSFSFGMFVDGFSQVGSSTRRRSSVGVSLRNQHDVHSSWRSATSSANKYHLMEHKSIRQQHHIGGASFSHPSSKRYAKQIFSSPSSSSSSALHMVLTTPESIIEEASTQKLLDDLIDESTRISARRPIIMQFDPSAIRIWRRWRGTVFSETWPIAVKNVIYAIIMTRLLYSFKTPLKMYLGGFNILWGQLLSVTTFTLTFFLNQSYSLWRKCYAHSRRLQGRMNDLGLTLAAHAARTNPSDPEVPSTYTQPARQALELVARYIRLFNMLTYASFTLSHRPILTPRGMRRMQERGLLTSKEREVLSNAKVAATQRHNAILMWITRIFIEARMAGHLDGGAGFENQFVEKIHVIRAQYGAIGDELQARMPLAYAHIVQVLVDVILWMYPITAFVSEINPILSVLGTGLMTVFYQGLFDLAKQFLNPYDNENYGKGDDPLCVDTLVAETNSGSTRWLFGFEQQPFNSERLREGEFYDGLPPRGYSVEELLEREAEETRKKQEQQKLKQQQQKQKEEKELQDEGQQQRSKKKPKVVDSKEAIKIQQQQQPSSTTGMMDDTVDILEFMSRTPSTQNNNTVTDAGGSNSNLLDVLSTADERIINGQQAVSESSSDSQDLLDDMTTTTADSGRGPTFNVTNNQNQTAQSTKTVALQSGLFGVTSRTSSPPATQEKPKRSYLFPPKNATTTITGITTLSEKEAKNMTTATKTLSQEEGTNNVTTSLFDNVTSTIGTKDTKDTVSKNDTDIAAAPRSKETSILMEQLIPSSSTISNGTATSSSTENAVVPVLNSQTVSNVTAADTSVMVPETIKDREATTRAAAAPARYRTTTSSDANEEEEDDESSSYPLDIDLFQGYEWFDHIDEETGKEYRLGNLLADETFEFDDDDDEEEVNGSIYNYDKEMSSDDIRRLLILQKRDQRRKERERKKKMSKPTPDQTQWDGVSQLWGSSLGLRKTTPSESASSLKYYSDATFDSVYQLWGGELPNPQMDLTEQKQQQQSENMSGISSSLSSSDRPTYGGMAEWFEDGETGPDGQEYRLSQMLADAEYYYDDDDEENDGYQYVNGGVGGDVESKKDRKPLTVEEFKSQAIEFVKQTAEELYETEAILKAPPAADSIRELEERKEQMELLARQQQQLAQRAVQSLQQQEEEEEESVSEQDIDVLEMDVIEPSSSSASLPSRPKEKDSEVEQYQDGENSTNSSSATMSSTATSMRDDHHDNKDDNTNNNEDISPEIFTTGEENINVLDPTGSNAKEMDQEEGGDEEDIIVTADVEPSSATNSTSTITASDDSDDGFIDEDETHL